MNTQKEQFFEAFKANKGQLNEIDLGRQLGLDKETTQQILSQLLAEHKIKYESYKSCEYRTFKRY